MKIPKCTFYKIYWTLIYVLAIIGLIGLISTLSSCSKDFYEQKFYDKGGEFKCEPTIVEVPTIIKGVDGKDSTVTKFVEVDCPKVDHEKTRFEIRQARKQAEDSLDHIYRMQKQADKFEIKRLAKENQRLKLENDSLRIAKKEETKQVESNNESEVKKAKSNDKTKQKESRSNWWKWFIGGIAFSVVVLIAWKTFKVYMKKRLKS